MASWLDEVNARMHAVVHNVHAVNLVFGVKVGVVSLLDVLDDWAPRVIVVHKVAKPGGVHDSQAQAHSVFFDIGTDGLDRDGLGDDVVAWSLALSGRVQGGIEERVDEGGFTQTGLT